MHCIIATLVLIHKSLNFFSNVPSNIKINVVVKYCTNVASTTAVSTTTATITTSTDNAATTSITYAPNSRNYM